MGAAVDRDPRQRRGKEIVHTGATDLNRSMYLDQDLSGSESKLMPDIPLLNRTETRFYDMCECIRCFFISGKLSRRI